MVLMAIGVALPALFGGIVAICISAVLVGGTVMMNTMAGIQEARVIYPEHAVGLTAAMTASFATGQVLGPLVTSYFLRGHADVGPVLLAASFVLLLAAIGLLKRG
jgi:hypothetical protein